MISRCRQRFYELNVGGKGSAWKAEGVQLSGGSTVELVFERKPLALYKASYLTTIMGTTLLLYGGLQAANVLSSESLPTKAAIGGGGALAIAGGVGWSVFTPTLQQVQAP